ncbi:hypothetical protein TNCV_1611341 [Trichonephila clavipes]|nr:hypothetical protein TNCV_1611341 [Trichonephila clavipes]
MQAELESSAKGLLRAASEEEQRRRSSRLLRTQAQQEGDCRMHLSTSGYVWGRVRSSFGLSTGCLGRASRSPGTGSVLKGPDKLDLIGFSGYKFRSASVKKARRSSAPRARNELKSALVRGRSRHDLSKN